MILKYKNKSIELGKRTLIMGILNVTPDSFSDGGNYIDVQKALEHAKSMKEEGADIIDIGGESTRPNYQTISDEEEIARIIPVIKRISKELDIMISVDTYKHKVARKAIEAGAHIINDIWGLQYDNGEMAQLVSESNIPLIAMHNQNTKEYPIDIIQTIRNFFCKTFKLSEKYSIPKENIVLDPGIGFGKGIDENLEVLKRLDELTDLGPMLLGTSKKGFIGKILGDLSAAERIEGTVATTVIGISKGVMIVRVHNVLENKRAALVADAVYR
ncbi:dihydropteroate synthase [Fusobacterium sp. PH5-44]|uniref:dihydropteroate synthase n=1 Tax=unclassified Fusobacterium TaxID=2648384 RepID=UPI003D219479